MGRVWTDSQTRPARLVASAPSPLAIRLLAKDHAMEEIKRQVNRAHRRLVLQQFLTIVAWSLFATLLVGAIGLTIPKIWVLSGIDREAWMWSWIGGSIAAGLLVAGVWTYIVR